MKMRFFVSKVRSVATALMIVGLMFLVAVFSAFYPSSVARAEEPPETQWVRQFGSPGLWVWDVVRAVVADNTGVYVAGWTDGVLPGQIGTDGRAYVRKYDMAGNEVWTRQFYAAAFGAAVDATGVYVVGSAGGAEGEAFIRKFDTVGNELWTRRLGPPSLLAYGAASDGTGVYIGGRTRGALPGQSDAGEIDVFVRKYDTNGTELWTRQFGTADVDWFNGIAVNNTGIYVVGETQGTLPGQNNAGTSDAFVRKYDSSGNEVWTRQFGTASGEYAYSVAVDDTGVYVAGETDGVFPGQSNPDGYSDAYVRKYDSIGNEIWTRQFSPPFGFARVLSVTADTGGVYVAGWNDGSFPGQSNVGGNDAFVRKYDRQGSELWTRQFGTTSNELVFSIAVHVTGIYVGGRTMGTFPGQTSAGDYDAFLAKLAGLPPLANNQSVTTNEDTAKAITLTATDVDGDALTYAIVAPPSHGSLSGTPPNVTYTPALNYNGSDNFTFRANDGKADSNIATVSITVNAVNNLPVANNLSVTTNEDTPVNITLSATDVDGDALTYSLVTWPDHGELKGNAPNLTFTPNPNYFGTVTFTYHAKDHWGASNVATVNITITSVNDVPLARNDQYGVAEDNVLSVAARGVLQNDEDIDGPQPLTAVLVSPSAYGAVILSPDGSFKYTPAANFNGADNFTYTAFDGMGNSNVATVSLKVEARNDLPVAQNLAVTTPINTPVVITLVATDVDGDVLTFNITAQPAHGTLSGTGSVRTYTPTPGYAGPDTFKFKAQDQWGYSNEATVSITVFPPGGGGGGP